MTLPRVLRRPLGMVGVVLLVCAVAVPLGLGRVALRSAQPETYVAGDGAPQQVAVPDGRAMMVWLDASVTDPECSVTDGDGDPVELAEVTDAPTQSAGKAGEWVGRLTFDVEGGSVDVSCDGVGQRPQGALVTPAPGALSGLSGAAVLILVALALAAAGLGCLARAARASAPGRR